MGKTYKRSIEDDDFIGVDDEFMDMDSDDNFDYLFDSRVTSRVKKSGNKQAGQRLPASRRLPADWQDFDYGRMEWDTHTDSYWR